MSSEWEREYNQVLILLANPAFPWIYQVFLEFLWLIQHFLEFLSSFSDSTLQSTRFILSHSGILEKHTIFVIFWRFQKFLTSFLVWPKKTFQTIISYHFVLSPSSFFLLQLDCSWWNGKQTCRKHNTSLFHNWLVYHRKCKISCESLLLWFSLYHPSFQMSTFMFMHADFNS
jgi:hypothetical protein